MKEQTVEEMILAISKAYGETDVKIKIMPKIGIWKVEIRPDCWYRGFSGEGEAIQSVVTSIYRRFCKDAVEWEKTIEEQLNNAKTLAGRLEGEG